MSWGCSGLCEERPGLPRAGHGRFQPAPLASPQGSSGPSSHSGGTLGKLFNKGGKRKEEKTKRGRNSRGNGMVRRRGDAPGAGADSQSVRPPCTVGRSRCGVNA